MNKADLQRPVLTRLQLARLAGVTRDAVNKWIRKTRPKQPDHRTVFADDPIIQGYILEQQIRINAEKALGHKKQGARTDLKVARAAASNSDERTDEEKRLLEIAQRRENAELRKLEAAAEKIEIQNTVMRGGLGNIKFLESLFFEQLNYAIRQFIILPETTIDELIGIIKTGIEKGEPERTRVDCVNFLNEAIIQIGKATTRGWNKNIVRIESELEKMTGE